MTFLISQRGKEYLETAQTLLRAAQTMTDQHVADQLKALAEDYERRADKASHVDAAKASARRSAASAELEWRTWPDGQPGGGWCAPPHRWPGPVESVTLPGYRATAPLRRI